MCFGGDKTTSTTNNSTSYVPQNITDAGMSNVANLQNLQNNGYQAYGGPRVAGATDNQTAGWNLASTLGGSSNPYTGTLENAYTKVANTAPTQIGDVSQFMNPYIEQSLAPQLRDISRQGAQQRQTIASQATGAGAFGDSRHGVLEAEQMRNEGQLANDTVGRGYSDAFKSALDIGKTNASLEESGLLRSLQGGTALQNLDRYNTGRTADISNLLQTAGGQQRGLGQNSLDALYQEYLRGQNWAPGMAGSVTGAISGVPYTRVTNGTGTSTAPDNSGYGILGSLAGAALAPMTGGASLLGSAASMFGGNSNTGNGSWYGQSSVGGAPLG